MFHVVVFILFSCFTVGTLKVVPVEVTFAKGIAPLVSLCRSRVKTKLLHGSFSLLPHLF